tara:strand:- start:503 stop:898 length:396 start_codon:yes stop_codon:yes gene_type:complete
MATVQEKELQMLFPETEVMLLGREFTIKPFSFYETMVVSKKLKSVLHLFGGNITAESLAEIYEKAFVGLVDVIALVYSLDRKTVEKMDMKNAIVAINGIIGVNKSFFVDSVEMEISNLTTSMGMQQDPSTK